MAKINKNKIGTAKNDTLVNKSSGFTYMEGRSGNDKYIVNNITNSATLISDKFGQNKLHIKNINIKNLVFISFSSDVYTNGLYIFNKGKFQYALNQLNDFEYYRDIESAPQSNMICIEGGSYYICNNWNIYTTDKNGIKYSFNLQNYFTAVDKKIIDKYCQSNDIDYDDVDYDDWWYCSPSEVLNDAFPNNQRLIKELLSIYNNTARNYTITGTGKADKITADKGNDIIKAGKGNDTIKGCSGNDKIYGGKGNDKIYAGSGNDIIYFNKGDGKDIVYKGYGSDTLKFNNLANISKLKSVLKCKKSGNNLIIKYTKKDSVTLSNYFKSGTSVKKLMAKNGKTIDSSSYLGNKIFNTYTGKKNKANKITGSSLNDLIKGNNKNDKLYGKDGNDTIYGNKGNDYIDGGNGNDKIYGNYGNNTLKGGSGNDTIYGGIGNDSVYAGNGNDHINAGEGNNILFFYKNQGYNTVICGGGTDTIVFKDETDFSKITETARFIGNDLELSSMNTKVLLKDFAITGNSSKYLKVGNDKIDLNAIFGINTNNITPYKNNEEYLICCSNNNDTINVCVNEVGYYILGAGNDRISGVGSIIGMELVSGRMIQGATIYCCSGNNRVMGNNVYSGTGNDYINCVDKVIYNGYNSGVDLLNLRGRLSSSLTSAIEIHFNCNISNINILEYDENIFKNFNNEYNTYWEKEEGIQTYNGKISHPGGIICFWGNMEDINNCNIVALDKTIKLSDMINQINELQSVVAAWTGSNIGTDDTWCIADNFEQKPQDFILTNV